VPNTYGTCRTPPGIPPPRQRAHPQPGSRQTHPACRRDAPAPAQPRPTAQPAAVANRPRPPVFPGRLLASNPCWSGPGQGWPAGPSPKATRSALEAGRGSTTLTKKRAAPTAAAQQSKPSTPISPLLNIRPAESPCRRGATLGRRRHPSSCDGLQLSCSSSATLTMHRARASRRATSQPIELPGAHVTVRSPCNGTRIYDGQHHSPVAVIAFQRKAITVVLRLQPVLLHEDRPRHPHSTDLL